MVDKYNMSTRVTKKPDFPSEVAPPSQTPLRSWLNTLLFDLHSELGRKANLLGMFVIVGSVLISMVGTISDTTPDIKRSISLMEFTVTVFFAVEYFLRLYAARRRLEYALSFYGLIDFLTWIPIVLFQHGFLALRLLRIFRLLKLLRYLRAMRLYFASLSDVFDMVFVVLATICIIILVSGNVIHLIEPETFPDAYIGCWWALVTMSTVGYGDLVPTSILGKAAAAVLMLTGITMFALLTGTFSVKLAEHLQYKKVCRICGHHISDKANYCSDCGAPQLEEG